MCLDEEELASKRQIIISEMAHCVFVVVQISVIVCLFVIYLSVLSHLDVWI